MIADLKPYARYHPAEGGWLGEIPSHWTVRRMKYVVRETDSRSTSGKEQLLRISQYTGVTQRGRAEGLEEADTRADSLIGYKRVEPNDLVINIMLAWNGSMGISRYSGIASPAYCVYRFGRNIYPWYFHNLLRSPLYKALIKASSTGVVESRLRLYSDDLGRIEAILPPPDEQAAIVRFLDWANGRLERAIRAKRKVIALLNEQKQAIIHRAVTRGLDPAVPLKPSGITWLGDIPAHWEVRRLKNVGETQIGLTYSPADLTDETGCLVLRASNIKDGKLVSADDVFVKGKIPAKVRVKRGDILICARSGSRSLVGKSALIPESFEGVAFGAFMSVFRSSWNDFVFWVLNSNLFKFVMAEFETSTINQLTKGDMNNLVIPLPPRQEQVDIVTYAKGQAASLDTAISRLEREIELLREYRTRLVADVVTGKLDVRAAAAKLPEEVDGLEPLDDADALTEGDEETGDAALDAVTQETEA